MALPAFVIVNFIFVFIFLMHSTLALAIVIFVSYNIMISTRHGNVVGMF